METITKYQAYDGREFFNKEECIDHETISLKIDGIISRLDSKPEGCDFTNGMGYIQHNKIIFLSVRKEVLKVAKKFTDHKWIQQSIDEGTAVDPSWAGRIISECANKSLNNAWHRISCTDNQFREWGQPFYRLNPDKADQVRVNP